ncbi:MAG: FtsX-like permease family protein, partial [Chitinophagaceae bacterium]
SKRAKEVGVRKVIGAFRLSLIGQFIGEAVMLATISMIIAIGLVNVLLPLFNNLTQKQISFPLSNGLFWLIIFCITLITGVISGSYPALFLSSFNPVKVLKGTLKSGKSYVMFRRGLVVFQFTLSIILIIAAIVISKQVNYIQTKNIGYNRENLIYIPQDGTVSPKYALFKQEALKMPGINSISRISSHTPANMDNATWGISWDGEDPDTKPTFSDAGVGYDFTKTMKIQILQGHDFRKGFSRDSIGYILNEAAVRETGYKNPIGKPFTLWGRRATIIGVIKDFNFNSLHRQIAPLVLYMDNNGWTGNILVRTQPGQTTEALANLHKLWKQMNPDFPFSYHFADEAYNQLYKSERMVGRLSHLFAILAIFISCLGLLGLVMFSAEQRTKELGIRKVLGASRASLFGLLSKEFLMLVLIALLVATPLAWWVMN